MDNILGKYDLQTIEQVRALADELRVRIVKQLALQAMTVTQLAELFGEAPNKLHYHVRELERVGLLKKVETREKGGILEKYYRAIARDIEVPKTLLSGLASDEGVSMLNDVIQPYFRAITRAGGEIMRLSSEDQPEPVFHFTPGHYWMTRDEFSQLSEQINTLLQPYEAPRGVDYEQEQTVLLMAYTTAFAGSEQDGTDFEALPVEEVTSEQTPSRSQKRGLIFVIGVLHFSRQDLEAFLAQNKARHVYVLGNCIFAEDVSPDLVEYTVASFHLRGKLQASPAIREVLKRKAEGGKKNG